MWFERPSVVWLCLTSPPSPSHVTHGTLHFLFPLPGALILWLLRGLLSLITQVSARVPLPWKDLSCSPNPSSLQQPLHIKPTGIFYSIHTSHSKISLKNVYLLSIFFLDGEIQGSHVHLFYLLLYPMFHITPDHIQSVSNKHMLNE